ncbi:MAG: hypothetical protein WC476_00820 [Phycisphaerae bacterium]
MVEFQRVYNSCMGFIDAFREKNYIRKSDDSCLQEHHKEEVEWSAYQELKEAINEYELEWNKIIAS